MTQHLSSEHIWQIELDGYDFNCIVSEVSGRYHCYKVKGVSPHYNKLTPPMRLVYRERVRTKAEELCKLKSKGLYL